MFLPTHDLITAKDICEHHGAKELGFTYGVSLLVDGIPNRVRPEKDKVGTFDNDWRFRDKRRFQPAIYRIYDKQGKIMYIGESMNVYQRILVHLKGTDPMSGMYKKQKQIDKIAISFFPLREYDYFNPITDTEKKIGKAIIRAIEQYYIHYFAPYCNSKKPTKIEKTVETFSMMCKFIKVYPKLSEDLLVNVFSDITRVTEITERIANLTKMFSYKLN